MINVVPNVVEICSLGYSTDLSVELNISSFPSSISLSSNEGIIPPTSHWIISRFSRFSLVYLRAERNPRQDRLRFPVASKRGDEESFRRGGTKKNGEKKPTLERSSGEREPPRISSLLSFALFKQRSTNRPRLESIYNWSTRRQRRWSRLRVLFLFLAALSLSLLPPSSLFRAPGDVGRMRFWRRTASPFSRTARCDRLIGGCTYFRFETWARSPAFLSCFSILQQSQRGNCVTCVSLFCSRSFVFVFYFILFLLFFFLIRQINRARVAFEKHPFNLTINLSQDLPTQRL